MNRLFEGVQLGLGLTQLGRRWGVRAAFVPTEEEGRELLTYAVNAGVRVFDTAPSYGSSEVRLGAFLRSLSLASRGRLIVMTKCGEDWDDSSGEGIVDHTYDALARSIERSLERLGHIDVLQLHRGNAAVLRSRDVHRAFESARALGIPEIGASVSDVESARVAVEEVGVSVLQFPFSDGNTYMEPAFDLARNAGRAVVINRPLGMGRLAYADEGAAVADSECLTRAFAKVLAKRFDGAVLTGTSSATHLAMNVAAFERAASASDFS